MTRWSFLLVACSALSCTQEDPPFGDPGAINKQTFPGESTTTSSSGGGADGGSPGGKGPFPKAYDAADPPPPDKPGSTLHMEKAGFALTPQTACQSCHGEGATGSSTKWAFGGWAAASAGSTTGLDKGEVIVVDGTTVIGPVKTASDGYFWAPAAAGKIGNTASVSIRTREGNVSTMQTKLGGNGNCLGTGTCHGGTGGAIDFKP